jgi:gluconolactonase
MMKLSFTILPAVLLASRLLAAESKIIAPGETLQKLAGGFAFTEGPACDAKGNTFFTDQPNDRIMEWSAEEAVGDMQPCGRANGLSFDHANLWACADGRKNFWSIGPEPTRRSFSRTIKANVQQAE